MQSHKASRVFPTSVRMASNTSTSFQTYMLRRLPLFSGIGLILVLQLYIIFSGSFQAHTISKQPDNFDMSYVHTITKQPDNFNMQDVHTISKQADNFNIDPKDALKLVPEHYWSAQDIENFIPASRNTPLIYFVTRP